MQGDKSREWVKGNSINTKYEANFGTNSNVSILASPVKGVGKYCCDPLPFTLFLYTLLPSIQNAAKRNGKRL
jgi:hypothetical protein